MWGVYLLHLLSRTFCSMACAELTWSYEGIYYIHVNPFNPRNPAVILPFFIPKTLHIRRGLVVGVRKKCDSWMGACTTSELIVNDQLHPLCQGCTTSSSQFGTGHCARSSSFWLSYRDELWSICSQGGELKFWGYNSRWWFAMGPAHLFSVQIVGKIEILKDVSFFLA